MNKATFLALAMLAGASSLCATEVSKVFASKMVLQRGRPVEVWGRAESGEEVTVSFAGQRVTAKADAAGDWSATLKPMEASAEGRDLVVVGATSNVFHDVLVGDVWICSGQSNMEMSFGWGVYGGGTFKDESVNFPTIRRMKVPHVTRLSPEPYEVSVAASWDVASNVFQQVTAAGYFFARKITQETGVPIGLLDASWSGCKIEPFITEEAFKASPELKPYADSLALTDPSTPAGKANLEEVLAKTRAWLEGAEATVAAGRRPVRQPPQIPVALVGATGQFNAMISPITRFAIKGVIWYQGCSNGGEGDEYADKMEALVGGWRKAWGYDFPFYWVQLASYTAATDNPEGGNGYARVRDAQRKALRIPKTGMAVAIDVGNPGDIHPKAKLFVGERLALWALAKDYGKNIVCSGPLVREAVAEQPGRVRLTFDYTGSGLMAGKKDWKNNDPVTEDVEAAGKLKGFALKGADGKWAWADAVIEGEDVVVSSPAIADPVVVRYAFRANPLGKCSLYNKEGLPASPFSVDVVKPAPAEPAQ